MRLNKVLMLGVLVASTGAWADAMPTRADGLWEIQVQEAGQAPAVVRQCTQASVDATGLLLVVPSGEVCKRQVTQRKGAWELRLNCDTHGRKSQVKVDLQGDFKTQYSGRFSSAELKRSGAFSGKWLGACEARHKPGDMVLPNGVTINWAKQQAAAAEHKAHGHKH